MLKAGDCPMNASNMLEKMSETLGSTAHVRSVFGEPIQMEGKTVIPIAKIAYGFGGGFGSGHGKPGSADEAGTMREGEGGGGGGGVRAFPAGALEITSESTRFVPFSDMRGLAAAFA